MGGKLKAMTGAECFDESYGVDGDGLGEGEVSYQEELENEIFAWSPDDDALMCASVEVVKKTRQAVGKSAGGPPAKPRARLKGD